MEKINANRKIDDVDFDESDQVKRLKNDHADLKVFLDWCISNEILIDFQKVKITKEATSHNYGMVAVKNLKSNEILARIPKSALLEPSTTNISELIRTNKENLKSESNWSKLIISIIHECSNPNSKWSAYLNLFPNYDHLDLPMYWNDSLYANLLQNTCIVRNVKADLIKMKKEFDEIILPFVKNNPKYFNESCLDFDYYKKIVGFVMAYSFRDPNENPEDEVSIGPMMVPVADILNAISRNNAQLCFEEKELTLVTTKPIKKDEEVFNTYGENSNTDLLHMYGYIEAADTNLYDSVEIPTKCFRDALKKVSSDSDELMAKKIEVLKELDLIDDNMSLVAGIDSILNEEECLHMLQIITMSASELKEFIENDYELLEDEDWDEFSLENENLVNLPVDWKELLKTSCEMHMADLKLSEENLKNKYSVEFENDRKNKQRVSKAIALIQGHLRILNNLIKSL